MNTRFLLILTVCILLIFTAQVSCKKEKSDPPAITILEPQHPGSYSIYDTIHVVADISDDKKITKLTCSVVNSSNIPVLPVKSFKSNDRFFTIDFLYVIDRTDIPTGDYSVEVFASDGESDKRRYQPLFINELPLKLTTVYIATIPNSGSVEIYKTDSNAVAAFQLTIPGDLTGSEISTKYNQFCLAGKLTGDITAINTLNQSVAWSVANNAVGGAPYFTGISSDPEKIYISRYDGVIVGYNHSGLQQFYTETDQNNFPTITLPVGNRLVAIEENRVSGNKNILIFNNPTGVNLFKIPFNLTVVSMLPKNSHEVYLAGNENNSGKIYVLDLQTAMLDLRSTSTAFQFRDAAVVDEYTLLLAATDGLYEFYNLNSNLVPLIPGLVAQKITYEEAGNEVYAARGNDIYVYGYQLHTLVTVDTISVPDTIRTFGFLYNREKFN